MGLISDVTLLLPRLFKNMDAQGEQILGTYLQGGGRDHDIEDASWTAYMKANDGLRKQVLNRLILNVRDLINQGRTGRFAVAERFHAECPENRDWSGYALLHGTNKDAGDFLMVGWATVEQPADAENGSFDIGYELRFVFNDIVDPNFSYASDSAQSVIADIVTLGKAAKYRLSIHWPSQCDVEIRPGQPMAFWGYPSEKLQRPVRPLPRAKLDWVQANRDHAQRIEARIIVQLKRRIGKDDTAGQADRKRRLLWLFYELSGYMSGSYLDRIKAAAPSDPLPRLLLQRISGKLLLEILSVLRGRKPTEPRPARDYPAEL